MTGLQLIIIKEKRIACSIAKLNLFNFKVLFNDIHVSKFTWRR